jgi:hypothetical protein
MNCFQLIKEILDEAYGEIKFSGTKKDALIEKRLASLSAEYKKLLSGAEIDYNDPITRFAYTFRYVTCHANIVFSLIEGNNELGKCFDQTKLSVSCIGGGPGSELLGILKFMENYEKKAKVMCHLLDKEKLWNETWSEVGMQISSEFNLFTNFMQLDILDKNSWNSHKKYLSADIFTLVYFMSEVHKFKKEATVFFEHFFTNVKPGAFVLFVDNRDSCFYNWFDELAVLYGFKIIETEETRFGLPGEEEKRDLGEFYSKFGSPKLSANIAYRIIRKKKLKS